MGMMASGMAGVHKDVDSAVGEGLSFKYNILLSSIRLGSCGQNQQLMPAILLWL